MRCSRRREGAEALSDCRQSRSPEGGEVLSDDRTKFARIVNVYGSDEKVEEAERRFDTQTKASVQPCFIVGNVCYACISVAINSNYLVLTA